MLSNEWHNIPLEGSHVITFNWVIENPNRRCRSKIFEWSDLPFSVIMTFTENWLRKLKHLSMDLIWVFIHKELKSGSVYCTSVYVDTWYTFLNYVTWNTCQILSILLFFLVFGLWYYYNVIYVLYLTKHPHRKLKYFLKWRSIP